MLATDDPANISAVIVEGKRFFNRRMVASFYCSIKFGWLFMCSRLVLIVPQNIDLYQAVKLTTTTEMGLLFLG